MWCKEEGWQYYYISVDFSALFENKEKARIRICITGDLRIRMEDADPIPGVKKAPKMGQKTAKN